MARKPLDQDLYDSVVAEAKRKFAVWPSAYASGWVVKTYKDRGGRYAGAGRKERTGLTKWFGEHWVDLSRPIREDGKVVGYEPCGRKRSDDPADYPKCRPAREAMRMSKEEVADAVRRKRRAEASAPARGSRARAPKRVATYKNPEVVAAGDCFRFATQTSKKIAKERGLPLDTDAVAVVHGMVKNAQPQPGERPWYEHAWVEYAGKAYDWQTEYFGRPVLSVSDFYALYTPTQTARYTPEQAMIFGLRTGHHGPWHEMTAPAEENPPPPQAVESDLLDAIEHADVYGDQGWTLDDFDVRYVGPKSLRAIREYEDWGGWIDTAPEDYAGLTAAQRLVQLENFRGKKWAERAAQWYATGEVPPVVVIEAPIVSENQLDWQIGDGRGRINFALAMGLRTLPVIEMRWKGARTNPRTGEYQGEHLPPGPDDGAPMHDVDNMMPDYCAHPDWYATGAEGRADAEAARIICSTRGRPWAKVWVYRAVPPGVKTINPGDWVTQVRDYAKEHLESNLGGAGRILKTRAKAGSLFTEGNSHFEWGWWPDAEREREFERMLRDKRARMRAGRAEQENPARRARSVLAKHRDQIEALARKHFPDRRTYGEGDLCNAINCAVAKALWDSGVSGFALVNGPVLLSEEAYDATDGVSSDSLWHSWLVLDDGEVVDFADDVFATADGLPVSIVEYGEGALTSAAGYSEALHADLLAALSSRRR